MTATAERARDNLIERTNRSLAAVQRMITWDDHWIRFIDVANHVVAFGHVMSESSMSRLVRVSNYDAMIAMHGDGYVLSETYSIVHPEGEVTSPHRSSLWPISARLFEDARASRWRMNEMSQTGKYALVEAYQNFQAHQDWVARVARQG